jgi:hypothetical protein
MSAQVFGLLCGLAVCVIVARVAFEMGYRRGREELTFHIYGGTANRPGGVFRVSDMSGTFIDIGRNA